MWMALPIVGFLVLVLALAALSDLRARRRGHRQRVSDGEVGRLRRDAESEANLRSNGRLRDGGFGGGSNPF